MVCFGNAEQPPGSPNPFSPQNCASGFVSRGQQRFSLKVKEAGRNEKLFFSFCICIGKWDVNASFDVSKSFLRSWSGRGTWVGWVESGRSIAAVLVRPNMILHTCCTVKVKHQLRRRLSDCRCVLLQLTSPAFTKYLPSLPFPLLLTIPPPC